MCSASTISPRTQRSERKDRAPSILLGTPRPPTNASGTSVSLGAPPIRTCITGIFRPTARFRHPDHDECRAGWMQRASPWRGRCMGSARRTGTWRPAPAASVAATSAPRGASPGPQDGPPGAPGHRRDSGRRQPTIVHSPSGADARASRPGSADGARPNCRTLRRVSCLLIPAATGATANPGCARFRSARQLVAPTRTGTYRPRIRRRMATRSSSSFHSRTRRSHLSFCISFFA